MQRVIRGSIQIARGRTPGTSPPEVEVPKIHEIPVKSSGKEYSNSSKEIWTSSFIDLGKVQIISGVEEEHLKGHMAICGAYAKVIWSIQVVTYSLGTAITIFFFPQLSAKIAAAGITFGLFASLSRAPKSVKHPYIPDTENPENPTIEISIYFDAVF